MNNQKYIESHNRLRKENRTSPPFESNGFRANKKFMNIRVENVTRKDKNVKKIYTESFSKKERMPFWLMLLMSKANHTDFLAFYDENILCGFIYMANIHNITFILFLAVDKNIRSKGYGSAILKEIQSMYPNNKFLVSIERCDEDVSNIQERIRRKNFYQNNGYTDTNYLIELANTKQEIMIKNGEFEPKEFSDFFKKYSNGSMNPKIWEKNS